MSAADRTATSVRVGCSRRRSLSRTNAGRVRTCAAGIVMVASWPTRVIAGEFGSEARVMMARATAVRSAGSENMVSAGARAAGCFSVVRLMQADDGRAEPSPVEAFPALQPVTVRTCPAYTSHKPRHATADVTRSARRSMRAARPVVSGRDGIVQRVTGVACTTRISMVSMAGPRGPGLQLRAADARGHWCRWQLRLHFRQTLPARAQVHFRIEQAQAVEVLDAFRVISDRPFELLDLGRTAEACGFGTPIVGQCLVEIAELRALAASRLVSAAFCFGHRFRQAVQIVRTVREHAGKAEIWIERLLIQPRGFAEQSDRGTVTVTRASELFVDPCLLTTHIGASARHAKVAGRDARREVERQSRLFPLRLGHSRTLVAIFENRA